MLDVVLVVLASQASAAINCREPGNQSEMTYCAWQDYKRADAVMTRQWQIAVANAKAADKEPRMSWDKRPSYFAALLEGQRAWLKFRDAHCVSEGYEARNGSMEPMLIAACKEELTKVRTRQLQDLAKGMNN